MKGKLSRNFKFIKDYRSLVRKMRMWQFYVEFPAMTKWNELRQYLWNDLSLRSDQNPMKLKRNKNGDQWEKENLRELVHVYFKVRLFHNGFVILPCLETKVIKYAMQTDFDMRYMEKAVKDRIRRRVLINGMISIETKAIWMMMMFGDDSEIGS